MVTETETKSTTATSFDALARAPDEAIDIAVGAALIAKDAYGDLDVDALVKRVEDLAGPLRGGALVGMPLRKQAEDVSARFNELGFRGNTEDYYDVKNSLLPDVLERRVGIPITLTVVWCTIARVAGVFARGVGFPGHFLARVDPLPRLSGRARAGSGSEPARANEKRMHEPAGEQEHVIVDPFERGRVIGEDDARALLKRALGEGAQLHASLFAPSSPRATLVRMLTNLKAVYASQNDHTRAFVAIDRMLSLVPDSPRMLRERAGVALRLGIHDLARQDLSRVLELEPEAPDAPMIQKRIALLAQSAKSTLN